MKKAKSYNLHFALCILDKAGFSLLELLIVLSLLSVGSAIALPALDRWVKEKEVRESALQLAATARNLRNVAVHEGNLQRLMVNQIENSYQAAQGNKVLPSEVKIASLQGGEPVGQGLRQFLFFPNGSSLGGEIGLSIRGGSAAYFVRVESLTGKVLLLRGVGQ